MNIITQIWRFCTFYTLRKSLGIARAADAQFTKDAAGMSDAFDIHQDQLVKEYNGFLAAITEAETAAEEARGQRDQLKASRARLELALKGALDACDNFEAAGNTAKLKEAEADAADFQAQIEALTAEEAQATADIAVEEESLAQLEKQLKKMQEEIRKLPAEKAKVIGKFVSSKRLAEAHQRIAGIKSNIDRSPIEAVKAAAEKAAAEARVSGRIAGVATEDREEKYLKAGADANATDKVSAMRAARKAERAAATGGDAVKAPAVTEAPANAGGDDRPKI